MNPIQGTFVEGSIYLSGLPGPCILKPMLFHVCITICIASFESSTEVEENSTERLLSMIPLISSTKSNNLICSNKLLMILIQALMLWSLIPGLGERPCGRKRNSPGVPDMGSLIPNHLLDSGERSQWLKQSMRSIPKIREPLRIKGTIE